MANPVCPTGTTYVKGRKLTGGEEVKGMCIDVKPVPNKAYNKFLVRTNKTLSRDRRDRRPLAPVVYVSYKDARAYCQSRGMRPLTEKEWTWAFMTSRYTLSMGMKNQSRLWEIVKMKRRKSSVGGAITGRPSDSGYFDFEGNHVVGLDRPVPSPRPRSTTTFRCAVEPHTFWKNLIIGLGVGLLVEPLLRGARFLGWENPR